MLRIKTPYLVFIIGLILVSCNEGLPRYSSRINGVVSQEGRVAVLDCDFNFSKFYNSRYGICWSEHPITPSFDEDLEASGVVDYYYAFNDGEKWLNTTFSINQLPTNQYFKAKTFIFKRNTDIVYSETFEFNTILFPEMSCQPNENTVIADGEEASIESIALYNYDNGYDFEFETPNYHFLFKVNESIGTSTYTVKDSPTTHPNEVFVTCTNKANGNIYHGVGTNGLQTAYIDNDFFFQFCSVNLSCISINCSNTIAFSGLLTLKI